MKKRNILWGIFFIVMAMIVAVSKLGILPDVGVFALLATVFLVWMTADGVRHRNFYESLFAVAFLCIIYDKPLGIEALTPWTVLVAALLLSIGLSLLFGGKGKKSAVLNLSGTVTGAGGWEVPMSSAAARKSTVKITLVQRSGILIPIIFARRIWRIILEA